MNVSVTSLSKLISTRKEELARLLEWRGTNFPVVERQNDLRISFIELELEDLEELNNRPQLNEDQQIVLEWLKKQGSKNVIGIVDKLNCCNAPKNVCMSFINLSDFEQAQVLQAFSALILSEESL